MRVGISAHFWPQLTVGSGQYLRHLVQELAQLEGDLSFLLIGEEGAFAGGPTPVPHVELSRSPMPTGRPAKLWFEQIALPRAARRLGLALLHVPYLAPPFFSPVPTVVTVHDLIPALLPHYRGSWRKRAYTWLTLQAARRVDMLIAVSEHTRQDTIQHLGYPADRIYVTYEAAAGIHPASPEQIAAVRQKYDLPERFVLYLGDTDRRKGAHRLMRVFARWRQKHPHEAVGLVLAGPRREPDNVLFFDLPALAQELGLAEVVRFLGPIDQEDKAALYSAATVFGFLSEYEGFGLPPLEAMACGTPLLAGRSSSVTEVVAEAGVLVDPHNEPAATAALERLLADKAWRDTLRQRGLDRAGEFTWKRTAEQTCAVYKRVLRNQ